MSEAGFLLQRFLQGHPRVLGALLLMIGLLQSAFGIILFLSPCAYRDGLSTHFSSAAVLVLAGILTLAADKAKSLNLACCMGMRGIALVLTSLGFFLCISMAAFGCKVTTVVPKHFPSSTEVNRKPKRLYCSNFKI